VGNPLLEQFKSDNFDASLEYYFSRNGFAAVSAFRRNLDGFVQPVTRDIVDPIAGPVRLTFPINTGEGRINGLEAQFQTFFDFEWVPTFLRNFGVQANYTYLDAKTEVDDPFGPGTALLTIVLPENPPPDPGGVSKHTYNLVGMYEGGGLSARLSYNKRGRFLDRRDDRGDDVYIEEAKPAGRLDLSTSYTISDNFTVFFDWTNILEDPLKVNFSSGRGGAPRAEYVRFLRFEETTMSLGVRFRL
jgi:TonB-dependent receptor